MLRPGISLSLLQSCRGSAKAPHENIFAAIDVAQSPTPMSLTFSKSVLYWHLSGKEQLNASGRGISNIYMQRESDACNVLVTCRVTRIAGSLAWSIAMEGNWGQTSHFRPKTAEKRCQTPNARRRWRHSYFCVVPNEVAAWRTALSRRGTSLLSHLRASNSDRWEDRRHRHQAPARSLAPGLATVWKLL